MSSSYSSPDSVVPVLHLASKVYQAPSILRQKRSKETLLQRSRTPTRRNSCACHFAKGALLANPRKRVCDSKGSQRMMIRSLRVVRNRGWRKRGRQARESRAEVLMRYAPSGMRIRAVACPMCDDLYYDRRILVSDNAISIAKELQECTERTVDMQDVSNSTGDRVRWFKPPHRESLTDAKMSALFTNCLFNALIKYSADDKYFTIVPHLLRMLQTLVL
jgi:hypothetical protein